jgi:hypothetical protein
MSIEETNVHRVVILCFNDVYRAHIFYVVMWYISLMSIEETNVNLVVILCFIDVYDGVM